MSMARWAARIGVLLALFLAGLALDLFLQARPSAGLDVGGRDLGYLQGFSAKEWSQTLPGSSGPEAGTYRWMGPAGTLSLGPLGAGRPLVLRLRMGRPIGPASPQVQLYAGDRPQATFSLGPLLQEYRLLLPPEALAGGMLTARLQVAPFRVEGDERDLGLVLDQAQVHVLGPQVPCLSWALLGALRPTWGLAAVAAALLAWALGLRFWPAQGAGLGLLALAGGLGAWRVELILRLGPTLASLLVLAAALAGTVRLSAPCLPRLAGWVGDRAHWVLLGLFLLALLLCFFPHIEADGIEYYAYLRSLAFDGDLHFANELSPETPFPHVPYGLGSKKTATGYEPNYASVGPAIVWTPFFALGHLLALAGHALGVPWTLDGYSEPYIVLICFGSALSGLVPLLVGYDLVRRLYGRGIGLLATVATFLGSGLCYYVFYKPDFAHALAACAVTVFVYLWMRTQGSRTWWQWLLLGLAGGFMTALYWIDAIFLIVVALQLAWEAGQALGPGQRKARPRGRTLLRVLVGGTIFAAAFLLAFSPQMIVWKILYGDWLTVPQEGFATPSSFAVLELILSPLHGLLPWTPVVLVGLLGLLLPVAQRRSWGSALLLLAIAVAVWQTASGAGLSPWLLVVLLAAGGLALLARERHYGEAALLLACWGYFLYNATLGSWHGGGTFGLRRLVNAYPFFLVGVAGALAWLWRWRREAAVVTAGLTAFWGLLTLLRYQAYTIPHYPSELEGLSLAEFLLAPDNMPLQRLPEVLRLSFFGQWLQRLGQRFSVVDLGYGLLLLALFGGSALGLDVLLRRWMGGRGDKRMAGALRGKTRAG